MRFRNRSSSSETLRNCRCPPKRAPRYHRHVRLVVLSLFLAACAEQDRRVEVVVLAGDQPETDAIVIFHRPSGRRLGTAHVDASGRAAMVVADDSLVTAVFPRDSIATRLITVAVESASQEIAIHGPPRGMERPTIGTITIAPAVTQGADEFWIRLACGGAQTTTWPVSVDIDESCVGADSQVPVIVIARLSHVPTAYTAGTVALDNGVATFAPAQWFSFAPNVPVINDVAATVDWTLWIDGLSFGPDDATNGGLVWQGLAVDRARVHARVGDYTIAQNTTREIQGPPTLVSFGGDDFLPAIPRTVTASGLPTKGRSLSEALSFSWANPNVDADVLQLALGWLSRLESSVIWHIVLPPDAIGFTSPLFEDELAELTPRDDPDLVLRYIDSPELVGFEAARAAGIFAVDASGPGPIVRPVSGQVRETWTFGFNP